MSLSLVKGQKISLTKEGGEALTTVIMGLGWDAKKKKGFLGFGSRDQEIDLDASCVLFDTGGNMTDVVWFRQLRSQDGSITHTGDNRTGRRRRRANHRGPEPGSLERDFTGVCGQQLYRTELQRN